MQKIPEEFWQGVEQFNEADFYACHDTLEAIWIDALPTDKKFYQGILQIAVALHHLSNQNWRGAVTLLGEGIGRLQTYQPTYAEIDVNELMAEAAHLLKQLQQVGAEGVGAIAQQLFPASAAAIAHSDLRLPTIQKVTNTTQAAP